MSSELAMSESEREAFVAEPRTMRVATRSPEGRIHNAPVWYVVLGDRICFRTDADSRKVHNIRQTGQATGVVDVSDEGYESLRGVMIEAEASVEPTEEFDEYETFSERLVDRYHGGELPDHVRKRNEAVDRVIVTLDPVEYASWDFRKVF